MVDEHDELDDSFDDEDGPTEAALAATEPSRNGADDEAAESLRELVTYIVHNLIDDPAAAEITADRRGSSVHIQVRLPEDDLGKVIGRGGRIAKAIRTVLLVAGSRHHLRVSLDIEG